MRRLEQLSDDEIDALLLHLFNGGAEPARKAVPASNPQRIEDLSHEALLRIRSRNHPDKWPNVNHAAYQAAVEELDRRRLKKSS